ncbi:MAG: flagellar protein FlaG [Thiotrichales bacterium]|jgi:flagellar protein FlaG|nr:flagellar protein FlaG [Thiotrichales bacterium]
MQSINTVNTSRVVAPSSVVRADATSQLGQSRLGQQQESESASLSVPPEVEAEQAKKLSQALDNVNKQMAAHESSLRFKKDDASGRMVVTIYDENTSQVIRQIPTKEALASAQQISDFLNKSASTGSTSSSGAILNSKA